MKAIIAANEAELALTLETKDMVNEAIWLTSKFGLEGEYQDVLGLCRIATIDEISEKNYSLTPGAYVGVAEVEDDGVDFHERMNEIHSELSQLKSELRSKPNSFVYHIFGFKSQGKFCFIG